MCPLTQFVRMTGAHVTNEQPESPRLAWVKPFAAPLIVLGTLAIFIADLHFPMGFVPWLPYLALALAVSRLYQPRTLILATIFWSLAILGEPLLRFNAADVWTQGFFNRAMGASTLWILTGLLYFDAAARRGRQVTETRLHAIVEGALDAVVAMDRDGAVIEWNPQAEIIFGYSRHEAIGKVLAQLIIPPEYREAHMKGLQRLLSTGQPKILRQRIEITALRKNGEIFPVELTVIPLQLGDQILFSSFIRDITERKRAEGQIQQSTAFIESMFDHLPNMVFVKDAKDLRFVRFNRAAEELLGYSRSELLGKNDYDFFPKDEADFFTAKDRETLKQSRLIDIPEEPIQTKSKGVRILHTKKIPIRDHSGTAQYLLGISEDITERKAAERALVEARLAAELASQAKGDFLANMSHEMRTPLTAIVGISDYLLRTELAQEQRELVHRCMRASDGLLRQIEDLLLAAKAESGTLQLISETFILQEIVSEATDLLRTEVEAKGLELIVDLHPALPNHVEGDAHRLQQVLLNLIRNALKFTQQGRITVAAAPSSDSHHTHLIQFSVADTGIGIDPDQSATIFDRFTQGDSRSNRQYGGVGLGLSICKRLVELMGGRIWVDSVKGAGSRFSFTVPFKGLQPALSPSSMASKAAAARGRRPTLTVPLQERGLSVLLAEDSIESQEVLKLYLRSTPHRVDCASTGIKVVSLYKEKRYDLVFMDLHMPEMDGLTATKLIREWEAATGQARTPILALTANGMLEAQRESLEAGCDDYLTKPIKMEQLLQAIERYSSSPHSDKTPAAMDSALDQEAMNSTLDMMRPKFLRNREKDIAVLKAAIGQEDFEQIQTIGHRIKGLAGSYGLDQIGQIGGAIEQAARARNIQALTQQVAQLVDALHRAQQAAGDGPGGAHRAA